MGMAKEIIRDMKELLQKLREGTPIEATRVERIDTPDGPAHIQTPVVLFAEREDEPS